MSGTATKERPILFSSPMVRAILEGHKTQTRRIIKGGVRRHCSHCGESYTVCDRGAAITQAIRPCPYGQPGDRLWVRETWQVDAARDGTWDDIGFYGCKGAPLDWIPERFRSSNFVLYQASWSGHEIVWRPSTHMPRWASRLTLEVTGVRVERLQEISPPDCVAEGVATKYDGAYWGIFADGERRGEYREAYATLWDSINGAGSWHSNPWVWVIEFRRAEK